MVGEAAPYEVLAGIAHRRSRREHNFVRVEYRLVLEDGLLSLVVAEGLLAEQELEEDDADRPDVNLVGDLRRVLLEALRSLIPVGADALARQLNPLSALVDDLAQAEVRDLDFAVVEDDVLRFQVKMNNTLRALVQILQAAQDLGHDQLGLLLGYLPVLL